MTRDSSCGIITHYLLTNLGNAMAVEIERKFKVINEDWRSGANGTFYRQGYLHHGETSTVRVRVAGPKGYLTIKGASVGASRMEYEYQIPVEEAEAMITILCRKPVIEKIRYKIEHDGKTWDVDEFLGENKGLTIAEIELSSESEPFELPSWAGEEVTGDDKYYNANLLEKPYSTWSQS